MQFSNFLERHGSASPWANSAIFLAREVGEKIARQTSDAYPLGSSWGFELARIIMLALGLGLGLLIALRWLQYSTRKRDANLNSSCQIKILERRALSPRATLYLLEIPGKRVLIAHTPTGLSPLGESPIHPFEAAMQPKGVDGPSAKGDL